MTDNQFNYILKPFYLIAMFVFCLGGVYTIILVTLGTPVSGANMMHGYAYVSLLLAFCVGTATYYLNCFLNNERP